MFYRKMPRLKKSPKHDMKNSKEKESIMAAINSGRRKLSLSGDSIPRIHLLLQTVLQA
jgi:hypothetical protein